MLLYIKQNRGELTGWYQVEGQWEHYSLVGQLDSNNHFILGQTLSGGLYLSGELQGDRMEGQWSDGNSLGPFSAYRVLDILQLSLGRSGDYLFQWEVPELQSLSDIDELNRSFYSTALNEMMRFNEEANSYRQEGLKRSHTAQIHGLLFSREWISFLWEDFHFQDHSHQPEYRIRSMNYHWDRGAWRPLKLEDLIQVGKDNQIRQLVREQLLQLEDSSFSNSFSLESFSLHPQGVLFYITFASDDAFLDDGLEILIPWEEEGIWKSSIKEDPPGFDYWDREAFP